MGQATEFLRSMQEYEKVIADMEDWIINRMVAELDAKIMLEGKVCGVCGGTGTVTCPGCSGMKWTTCARCRGKGVVRCPACEQE
jgi:hypothetical protein